jgi:hypothetical protein
MFTYVGLFKVARGCICGRAARVLVDDDAAGYGVEVSSAPTRPAARQATS